MAETLQTQHKVKIRKEHVCQGCGKRLEKGQIVTSSTFADGGKAYTFYECDTCADHVSKICATCSDADVCICENYYVGLIAECIREMGK